MGHGFQFSPELFFACSRRRTGRAEIVRPRRIGIRGTGGGSAVVRERLEVVNGHPTYVMVRARKVAEAPLFATIPQQSDYRDQSWRGKDIHAPPASEAAYRAPLSRRILRGTLPRALKLRLRALAQAARNAYTAPHLRKREP
jgi:hypothetical protein